MSRHYYDIYRMHQKLLTTNAFKQKELLAEVTRNNLIFFKDNNAFYETAKIGSLKLYPSREMMAELQKDYNNMHEMFMNSSVRFIDIMDDIQKIEHTINQL